MQSKLITLHNGLPVLLLDTQAFPSLTVLLLVKAGSRVEDFHNNGIAHFFEHMVFKGSKKYPSALKISSLIDGFGGIANAFTAKDYTGYWIKAPKQYATQVLQMLADMIREPLLREKDIEREKGVIVEEISMYEDDPPRKVMDIYENLLYKNTSLGFDITGTKKTVTSFNRQTFLDYIDKYYRPNNAILVLAGGLNGFDSYATSIESYFGSWSKKEVPPYSTIFENQQKPEFFVFPKKTEQAHFVLGVRAFSYLDERKYALHILSALLGGGMSSRLFHELRERRGLCYYVSSGREFYSDVGNFYVRAGVNMALPKVHKAIKLIIKEFLKITQGALKNSEIVRAKELIKGRLVLSLEDSFNIAYWFGKQNLLEQQRYDVKEIMKKIDNITKEELTELAQELFIAQHLNLAVIGPYKNTQFDASLFESLV